MTTKPISSERTQKKLDVKFLILHGCYFHGRYIMTTISNGNRTEWSPIRSVIIQVINKIGRPRSGSPICLITSMITDRIGQHEVLLPINHNFNKILWSIRLFFNQNTRNPEIFFAKSEKKSHLSAHVMARTVQLLKHDVYCPI